MTEQILLGQQDYNTIIFAEVKDGKIKGFNGYDYISSAQSYDENRYLSMCSWTHEETINGVTYKSGMLIDKDKVKPYFSELDLEGIIKNEDFYFAEGHFCGKCGTFHDSEQYYDHSYVVVDCEVYCKDCVKPEELLVEVISPEDIFSAKDMTGYGALEGFEEVDTLFCDSSGFGSASERALTKQQAEQAVYELLEEHNELYAGITGIGQFQVYVTLYRRTS